MSRPINDCRFSDKWDEARPCVLVTRCAIDWAPLTFRMNPSMTTTAFEMPGYRIVKTFGVVRGIIVRSRSIFGTIGAGLQTLVGGNISILTNLCEKTRQDALEQMLSHARQLGANAVVGLRYDATEVLCYGTAALVEPQQA